MKVRLRRVNFQWLVKTIVKTEQNDATILGIQRFI